MEQKRGARVMLVVNGGYGDALLEAAEVLVGGLDVGVVEVPCMEESADRRERIASKIEQQCGPGEVLLLTDLLGSTPANVCLTMVAEQDGWEMLSGLNLPMLMKLSTCEPRLGAAALARELCHSASRCCRLGSDILQDEKHGG